MTSERISYSLLEQKYVRLADAYAGMKAKNASLKRTIDSYKEDLSLARRRKRDVEREFNGYVDAGRNSAKSYREIIRTCAGRLRGFGDEDYADRLEKYLYNMELRVQPTVEVAALIEKMDSLVDATMSFDPKMNDACDEARDLLREVRGYDRWEDVRPLPVKADDSEV